MSGGGGGGGGAGPHDRRKTVAIAGAGIAGIAAAVALADRGWRVELIETRKKLGGRATSFTDPRTGEVIDNCQHVALRCCTAYRALCDRLGVTPLLRWDDTQTWVEAGGRASTIKPSFLPAPLHYGPAFAKASFLTLAEKLAVAGAMHRIRTAHREKHTHETFGVLLRRWKQPEGAIRKFWDAVVVGACNAPVDRVCAASALYVFQEGFLSGKDAGTIGVSTVPLVRLYDGAQQVIEDAGGVVRLGASVTALDARSITLASGERIDADRVICALPFERALKVVDPALAATDERFDAMGHLEHSPILGVHLEFDRPVLGGALGCSADGSGDAGLDVPHVVLVDRPTHWLFRKDPPPLGSVGPGDSKSSGVRSPAERSDCAKILREHTPTGSPGPIATDSNRHPGPHAPGWGRIIHAVISAADSWMGLTEPEIVDRVLADTRLCLPWTASHRIVSARAVKEKRATFVPTVEAERARAWIVAEGASGIVLAGDYTATGWPATMEGAARSGAAAGEAIGR